MDLLETDTAVYEGERFRILYTGMRDGKVLDGLVDDGTVSRDSGNKRLYFTVSEFQARTEYAFRGLSEYFVDSQPVVLETWFHEDRDMEEWSSDYEFVVESYDIENIRGFTDVETGEFVHHGEGWQPEGLTDRLRHRIGLKEGPDYIFPDDTEFEPL